jgi:hypothetical protein
MVMVNKAERRASVAVHTLREETSDMTEEEKEHTKGKGGMSLRHEFLIIKDRNWDWFNILTAGLVPGGVTLPEAIQKVQRMKDAALHYTRAATIPWSKNIGLYFHCYPHVHVFCMHLHIVDLDKTGPTFESFVTKNLSIDDVLAALREELATNTLNEQEAALTTEFQNFIKCVTPEARREYREMYFKTMTPFQREKMRRNLLYNTQPLPWRRAKDPLQRLDERLRSAGRPILSFM